MKTVVRLVRRFLRSREGNFALLSALALVPMFGAAGLAVDYSRALDVQTYLQTMADDAALNAAPADAKGKPENYVTYVKSKIANDYGKVGEISSVEVTGQWMTPTDFEVSIKGKVPLQILASLPGFPHTIPISAESVVRIGEPEYAYTPPKFTQLDPDAADYNRIYIYCFDPAKSGNKKNGRSKITAIADNAGTKYDYKMPKCKANQYMSFELYNVRNSRTQPNNWDNQNAEHYEYFTDTVIENGVEHYALQHPILETIMCEDNQYANTCKPTTQGGVLPEGAGRTPAQNDRACAPGEAIYYGWEDRPPDTSSSDRDYNDIRIVMACPTIEKSGDKTVRLIR